MGETDKEDLHDLLGEETGNQKELIKGAMLDITEGLAALHQRNIVYHNINLSNVQLSGDHYKLKFACFREILNFN